MKITKYPQSCLFVETAGQKLLFDPGNLKYEDRFFETFNTADAVFITHKHADHCYDDLIARLDSRIPLYMTEETAKSHPKIAWRATVIREGDEIACGGAVIRAVYALHGYHPNMKGNEVSENIGYTVREKETLYITSDTICFPSDTKAGIIAVPVTGYGVTMSAFEASLFAKEAGAECALLTHMDNPAFEVFPDFIRRHFDEAGVRYVIPETGESVLFP